MSTCDPQQLITDGKCFSLSCLTADQQRIARLQLLCEILNGAGGGGVTSIIAGAGISVNAATGDVTVTNTARLVAYVDNFTTPGANVWTKRTGFVYGYRIGIGGGGGGGSGRKGAAGSSRGGGAQGGVGGVNEGFFIGADVGSTETVIVGSGGNGGASQTSDSSNGNPGSAGGSTTMTGTSVTFSCLGGTGGVAGSNGIANQLGPVQSTRPSSQTFSTNGGSATVVPYQLSFCGIGCGGVSINTANSMPGFNLLVVPQPFIGNSGGFGVGFSGQNAGGLCGVSDGLSAANGSDSPIVGPWGGGGGGGGYASLLGNAGKGGNGGRYGASGGGGGASVNSVGNSGAGGNGAQGMMQVISYCLE